MSEAASYDLTPRDSGSNIGPSAASSEIVCTVGPRPVLQAKEKSMKVAALLCVTSALLLPAIAAAQTATNQAARQRAANETRENAVENSRVGDAKERYDDANSPGNSGNSKGKKGEAPGQEKKDNKNNDKSKSKSKDNDNDYDRDKNKNKK